MNPHPPLRLWPGVLIVALQWAIRFVVPVVAPDASMFAVLGGLAGGALLLIWWLGFSRAPWPERLGAIVLMVAAVFATKLLVHPSIAHGMMGMMLPISSVPLLSLALVVWAAASRSFSAGARWGSLLGVVGLACGAMLLVRTDGLRGAGGSDYRWRWSKTPEEQLLAETSPASSRPPASSARSSDAPPAAITFHPPAAPQPAVWPSFRGPQRDGVVRGVRIATDWSLQAPVELWRHPIGPGWSSFAVQGDRFYTQEQRGDDEQVSCYDLATGQPVWSHADAARFWESNGGAGPRGTPTLAGDRVYTLGATGILNALDARTGAVAWTRNAASDTQRKIPGWGFASSPLIVGDTVIVATAGVLAAYDAANGQPRWFGPKGGYGYSSPHLATIAGVTQVVLPNGTGVLGVAPEDGRTLWEHPWPSDGIVQPVLLADGDLLLGSGSGLGVKVGVRRLALAHSATGWSATERWTSNRLKPYFNDFVAHAGHAYGFDGNTLACLDLADGERKWKGGRYGGGQLILLADQDLLLVLSEQGDLALVRAVPGEFRELSRIPALTSKTWNHPVLAGDVLLVRNDREMIAFRLKLHGG